MRSTGVVNGWLTFFQDGIAVAYIAPRSITKEECLDYIDGWEQDGTLPSAACNVS